MKINISTQEMYRLINEAVAQCGNDKGISVSAPMQKFQQNYWQSAKNNRQLNVFEDNVPSIHDVYKASDFCNRLDDYRVSIDVFNKEDVTLGDEFYRQLYDEIEYFRPHIATKNQEMFNALSKNIRKKIPEFRNEDLLNEYNERALNIYKLKKEYEKNKRKNKSCDKFYEDPADRFFSDLVGKKELRDISSSVKKLTVYSNCLKIVDCLPDKKYNRTSKYKLKYNLNLIIASISKDLGDGYALSRINAEENARKYINAISNTKKYAENTKKSNNSLRAKRMHDEYYYK